MRGLVIYRLSGIALLVFTLLSSMVSAQGGGQFCLRAFEDRNGNGTQDGGEPLLTRGLSVNLLDAQSITIASALLDQSPTAAQGVVCFQFLTAGQYTLTVTSAEYNATTPTSVTTSIAEGGLPTLVEFGGRLIGSEASATPTSSSAALTDRDTLARVLVSALAALVVVGVMMILGVAVYLLAFRNRKPPVSAALDPRRTTGSMSAVRARDTGEFPKT